MGKNNKVELLGEISSEFRYYFKSNEQTFYMSTIKIERNSGNFDEIPFVVSGRITEEECSLTTIIRLFLDGYICKEPIYRKTPLGKEITDIILAVNRDDGKSDYIPCIAWHRNARIMENLPVGAHIKIDGRVQSRQYVKKLSEEYAETRTAYEVSIWRLGVLSGEECKDQVATYTELRQH